MRFYIEGLLALGLAALAAFYKTNHILLFSLPVSIGLIISINHRVKNRHLIIASALLVFISLVGMFMNTLQDDSAISEYVIAVTKRFAALTIWIYIFALFFKKQD